MNVAIITARLGSKRIPKKNIKSFFGKPVIYYSINTCQKSNLFDQVLVSTESELIAKIAKKYGASVPFLRKKKLADDKTGTLEVIRDIILRLKIPKNTIICCMYPVAPLITPNTLSKALKIFKNSGCSFLLPIIKLRSNNIKKNSFKIDKKNFIKKKNNTKNNFIDAGQFYFGRAKNFLNKNSLIFSGNSKGFVMSSKDAIDVNTKNDWLKLKELYKNKEYLNA